MQEKGPDENSSLNDFVITTVLVVNPGALCNSKANMFDCKYLIKALILHGKFFYNNFVTIVYFVYYIFGK